MGRYDGDSVRWRKKKMAARNSIKPIEIVQWSRVVVDSMHHDVLLWNHWHTERKPFAFRWNPPMRKSVTKEPCRQVAGEVQ